MRIFIRPIIHAAAVGVLALILVGCQDFSAQVFEQDLPRVERSALYCYSTLGRSDCYETAIEGWEDRLIGVRQEYIAPVEDDADAPPQAAGQPPPGQPQGRQSAPTEAQQGPGGVQARGQARGQASGARPVSASPIPTRPIPERIEGQPLTLVR